MPTVRDIAEWMNEQAPLSLSESWDNTGLLLGDWGSSVHRIQTCLTLTHESATEAINQGANLVIAHHPIPFRALSRITTDTQTGRLLWRLANAHIAIYSPHTAWDSAEQGINAQLAEKLGLQSVRPLIPSKAEGVEGLGAGRLGELPNAWSLREIADTLSRLLPTCRPRGVDSGRVARRIAIACGSGGSLLEAAIAANCDLFLTGEATFHTCLEAQDAGISLLMIGHFASERFSLVELAARLHRDFPDVQTWASEKELDPVVQL